MLFGLPRNAFHRRAALDIAAGTRTSQMGGIVADQENVRSTVSTKWYTRCSNVCPTMVIPTRHVCEVGGTQLFGRMLPAEVHFLGRTLGRPPQFAWSGSAHRKRGRGIHAAATQTTPDGQKDVRD